MKHFIKKILNETKEINDDPFFQPKLQKRNEDLKKRKKDLIVNLRRGLQRIKESYENKKWETKQEETFLRTFHECYLYNFTSDDTYCLKTTKGIKCSIDPIDLCFKFHDEKAWEEIARCLNASNYDINRMYAMVFQFMEEMIKKYFKLNKALILFWQL